MKQRACHLPRGSPEQVCFDHPWDFSQVGGTDRSFELFRLAGIGGIRGREAALLMALGETFEGNGLSKGESTFDTPAPDSRMRTAIFHSYRLTTLVK